jgi:WD40 repeat protein
MSVPKSNQQASSAPAVCATCNGPLANVMGAQCPRCLLNLASTLGLTDEAGMSSALLDPFQVRTFGDYELLEEIARGGMGVVYRARQISLGREVAIKMILAGELAGKGSIELFQREAHAAANLHHPNIVPVYEIGEHQTQHYFAMRFVPGGKTIADWAAGRRGDFCAIASAVARVGRAVAYAHSHGVLHRDLKPANILWDEDAGPQITDFGLAKLIDAPATTVTLGARTLGSPSYMAPEQAEGRLSEITTATDVYGIGAVLYELLAGRPPFAGASVIETMRRVAEDAPESLPNVPRDLWTICLKCLAKAQKDRYASAAALADDLERFARGEPVSAVPLTPLQTAWRWAKRHPLVASLAMLSLVSVLTAIAGITWQWRNAEVARRGESAALQKATATVMDLYTHSAARETDFTRAALWFAKAAAEAPDARRRVENLSRHAVWQRESHTAVRAFESGIGPVRQLAWNPAQTALLGRTTNRAAIWDVQTESRWASHDVGDFENAAWAQRASWVVVAKDGVVRLLEYPSGRELARTNYQGESPQLAVASDDRWVLIAGSQSFLWSPLDGLVRRLPDTPAPPRLVEFSPDGQLVMLCVESTVGVCAVEAPQEFLFPPAVCRSPTMPGFLRNDAFFTCLVNDRIAVLDSRTGELMEDYPNTTRRSCTVGFASRDGRYIVTSYAPMLERKKGFKSFPVHLSTIDDADFSRDGSWLVTAGADSVLRRWPLPGGEPAQQIGWHQERVTAVAISPDQRFVGTAQGGSQLIKVWRLGIQPPAREIRIAGDSSVRLSANGQWLLPNGATYEGFHLRRTRVFSVETLRPLGGEMDADGDIQDAEFAPDGGLVALAVSTMARRGSHDFVNAGTGHLQLWNWQTGELIGEPIDMPSEPRGVAVHPSGNFIAMYCAGGELVELPVASRTLRVLRPATGTHPAGYRDHNGRCRYSPDGRWIIGWGMRTEPVVYDREAGKVVVPTTGSQAWVNDVAFHRGVMATVSDQSMVEFHNMPGFTSAAFTKRDNDRLFLGRFSPEGNLFLTAGRAQVAHVWDWQRGRLNVAAMRHDGEIYAGVFVPGTECIATGGLDDRIRFWDRRTGLPMRPPIFTSRAVLDLSVTPDGRTLIRGSHGSGLIKFYDLAQLLPESKLNTEDALLLAEIDAAAEIINGGIEPLNASAWLAKWKQFRGRHPQWHQW